jgi:hypothetical protein
VPKSKESAASLTLLKSLKKNQILSITVADQELSYQCEEAHSSKDHPYELQEMVHHDARTVADHGSRNFRSCGRFSA